jgi:hypothetical protein
MYPITNEIKALFEAEQRKVLRISGTDKNGATISITDNDVIADSFQVDRYSCNGEKLEVGTAIAAQLTMTLENGGGQYNGIVFEGAELFVEVGIADWTQSSPTITYVPCGYFTPDMQPRRLSTISITALDRMTKFDVVVDAAALTFPTTVAGLVGQVCTLCGVMLAQSISGLVNAGVNVAELPAAQEEITYRNLIQWCAGVMGTNAWFDWSGQLRFSWYENATGYVSTVDNRYSSDLYEDDLTVSGVEYTNDSGIVIVEGTDDYAIDLTGNAIAGLLVATVLPPLNTALNGFTYRPFTAATVNAPYLWPMDVVTFTDKDGNDHTSVLTNVAFGLNGTTAMESKGMTYAINKLAQPKGFTREQAQLVNQAMEHVEKDIDESLTQQEIFNRLTDDGAAQGLILYNGQLYINASYISAGEMNVEYINFNAPVNDFDVPKENNPDTLLDGQTVVNGWIVNESGSNEIVALECKYAKLLRGRTITLAFTFNGELSACEYYWYSLDGEGGTGIIEPVSPANPYTYYFTVPNEADSFHLVMTCGGLKQISATVSGPQIVYPDDIQFSYAGLQIGNFLVDRSGNMFGNGWNQFDGTTQFNGDVYFKNPSAVLANLGAVAKSGDTMTGPLTVPKVAGTAELNISGRGRVNISNKEGTVDYNHAEIDMDDDTISLTATDIFDGWTSLEVTKDGVTVTRYDHIGDPSVIFELVDSYEQSDAPLTIGNGGTGATTAAGARANLGVTPANIGAVSKAGDTMTGPLTVTGADIILTTGYLKGQNDAYTNHAIKLGHRGDDKLQFLEYSGQFDFYKSQDGTNTLLFQVKDGASAKPLPVNNGGTGATTPAGARANLGFLYDIWASKSTNIVDVWNASFLSSGNVTVEYLPDGILHIVVQGISTKNSIDWLLRLKSQYVNFNTTEYAYFTYYLGNTQHTGYVTPTGLLYFQDLNTTSLLSANISIAVG